MTNIKSKDCFSSEQTMNWIWTSQWWTVCPCRPAPVGVFVMLVEQSKKQKTCQTLQVYVCVWERPRLFNDCSGRAVAVRLHFKDLYSRRSVFASVTEKQEMASHTLQQWQFFTLWFLTCCCITGCLRLAQGRAFVLQMLFVSDSFSTARMPRQEHYHNSWENTQEHKRIHKY